jgi:hypothetical protein
MWHQRSRRVPRFRRPRRTWNMNGSTWCLWSLRPKGRIGVVHPFTYVNNRWTLFF